MAYARIALFELRPGTMNRTIEQARTELRPLFRRQPGFLRYSLFRTTATRLVSVTLWETREAAEAAVKVANAWIGEHVPEAIVDSETYIGELLFEEGAAALAGVGAEEAEAPMP